MQTRKLTFIALSPLLLLAACASPPMGPTVQVLPSPNKPFQVFQHDQFDCKQYAQSQVAGQAEAANQGAVGSAAVGVVLGGLLGAAIGGHQGAGVGAGVGAIAGTSAGANSSAYGQGSIQAQYNNAYVQCMYSRGNQVPGAAPAYYPRY
ncbi:MAG: glycine zipper family protein [Rhodoferax sp.]